MKILFVFPSTGGNISSFNFNKIIRRIPFTFAQLIAITSTRHIIEVVDERYGDKIDFNKKYDLVAITCLTIYAMRAYEIADIFRQRGITVVIGGYHASALPNESKKHADSVVISEAELTWPKLLKDFENGNLNLFYKQEKPVDSSLIPSPFRGSLNDYNPCIDVQATRGCPFKCEFCAIQNVEGSYYRKRPIENVINEIKKLKNKSFSFSDPSLTIDVEYSKSLFKDIKGLGKRFLCHGNINVLNENEDLIKISKEAGCQAWFIGFESINQESLNSVKKKNTVKIYEEAVKKIRKYGVAVKGLFMFGFDGDTKDTFTSTLKFVKKIRLDVAYFSVLTPLPGTPIFERLEKEGRILTKDWSKYSFNKVVFQPKNMTSEELYNNTRSLVKNYYSYNNMFRRTLDNEKLDFTRFRTKLNLNLIDRISIKKEFDF
jgi:radical SAM superfamily enzyme YgiQ (UPF0313 family)